MPSTKEKVEALAAAFESNRKAKARQRAKEWQQAFGNGGAIRAMAWVELYATELDQVGEDP